MTEHYFSAAPGGDFGREEFTCEVWGHELTLESGAGVFSKGHLDHATAVLFRETDPPTQGRVYLDAYWDAWPVVVEIEGIHHEWESAQLSDTLRQNDLTREPGKD